MRELSMHILDLAQNSIAADASRIEIEVVARTAVFRDLSAAEIPKHQADTLTISIADNGRGMPAELLASVGDPFTTTRTTRRVGLGIPMFSEAAKACDGYVSVESQPGNGTKVTAAFRLSHIDRAPLGDMASTLVALIAANPDTAFRYMQRVDGEEFVLDTDEIKARLDGVSINESAVLRWIADYVNERAAGL